MPELGSLGSVRGRSAMNVPTANERSRARAGAGVGCAVADWSARVPRRQTTSVVGPGEFLGAGRDYETASREGQKQWLKLKAHAGGFDVMHRHGEHFWLVIGPALTLDERRLTRRRDAPLFQILCQGIFANACEA